MADSGKDRLGEKLRDLEQAREHLFFAERDRQLIEKLRAQAADHWHAEVTDVHALIRAVAEGVAPLAALQPNQDYLDAEAARAKEALDLPGVRAVHDPPS